MHILRRRGGCAPLKVHRVGIEFILSLVDSAVAWAIAGVDLRGVALGSQEPRGHTTHLCFNAPRSRVLYL